MTRARLSKFRSTSCRDFVGGGYSQPGPPTRVWRRARCLGAADPTRRMVPCVRCPKPPESPCWPSPRVRVKRPCAECPSFATSRRRKPVPCAGYRHRPQSPLEAPRSVPRVEERNNCDYERIMCDWSAPRKSSVGAALPRDCCVCEAVAPLQRHPEFERKNCDHLAFQTHKLRLSRTGIGSLQWHPNHFEQAANPQHHSQRARDLR